MVDQVEKVARSALFEIEMARTHLVQPVNGSFDYFYVSFAGQRIEFRLDEDQDSLRGPYDQEIAALSAKAAECATTINDTLFDLAKKSAREALSSYNPNERLREALEYIARHDAAANGLSGFAFELVEQLTGAARAALSHKD